MSRKLVVLVCLFMVSAVSFADVGSRRNTFVMLTKNLSLSGCYSVGKSLSEYSACMDANDWSKAEQDSGYLQDRCRLLDAADPEKAICFDVAELAATKIEDRRREQVAKKFTSTYEAVLSESNGMCYKPGIPLESMTLCIMGLMSSDEIAEEVGKMRELNVRASRDADFRASEEAGNLSQAIAETEKLLHAKREADTEEVDAAKNEEYLRELAKIDAADERQLQREMRLRETCGEDYGTISIGMSKERMRQCVDVVKVGERRGNIEVYKAANGAVVIVSGGKVDSWEFRE